MISASISESATSIALLVSGIVAVAIAVIGKDRKTYRDEALTIIGFILGAVMIFLAVMIYYDDGFNRSSTFLICLLLGIGLFFRVFRKIRWSSIISFSTGIIFGIILYLFSKSYDLRFVTPGLLLAVVFIVILVLYFMLRVLEAWFDFLGGIISFRPILFVLGLVAIVEGILILVDSPIYTFF